MPSRNDASSSESDQSKENKLEPYRYSELKTQKSIRLLALQPGRKGNDVNCELIEVQLETEDREGQRIKAKKSGSHGAVRSGHDEDAQRDVPAKEVNGESSEKMARNGAVSGTDGNKSQRFKFHERRPSRRATMSSTKGLNLADIDYSAVNGSANGVPAGPQTAPAPDFNKDESTRNGTGTHNAGNGNHQDDTSQQQRQSTGHNGERKHKDHTKKDDVPDVPFLGDPGAPSAFEAVSWSWGIVPWDSKIYILKKGVSFQFPAPQNLVNALKALRHRVHSRMLWIDVVCINQTESDERNQQVSLMSEIYGQARNVCVWLGDEDKYTKSAFDFIQKEVVQLQDFDKICNNPAKSDMWNAMLNVMKRPWFSRRWVVQEIALAREATIYCGRRQLPWKDFADAVQLMVEVETATHRLSEVIQKDPNFYHVPRWFDNVSALGASRMLTQSAGLPSFDAC